MYRSLILTIISILFSNAAASAACVNTPSSHMVAKGDIAIDKTTHLIWKRCTIGMEWDEEKKQCIGDPQGFNQKDAQAFARESGSGWRVPTGAELESLIIDTCEGPKVDTNIFPDIEASDFGEGAKFWTSTEAMAGMFYFADLQNGYIDIHSKGYLLSLLLVKDE